MATIKPDLAEQAEAVRSRDDLADFVRELVRDFRERPGGWENRSLDDYLESLAAWVEDADGYYRNRGEATPPEPSWKTLAEILLAARVYE